VLVDAEYFDQLTATGTEGESELSEDEKTRLAMETWATDRHSAAFPAVGTPEWGRMNRKRAELIRKKLRGELTEPERRQYEWLQRQSLQALNASFPRNGQVEVGAE
jgi:hypothetical protein